MAVVAMQVGDQVGDRPPEGEFEGKYLVWNERDADERGRRGLVLVHGRVSLFHFGSGFEGCSETDQGAGADAGAVFRSGAPGGGGLDEFGPEREEAALGGFGGVDGAAVVEQEGALAVPGFAEAEEVAGAVDEAAFELGGVEMEEGGGAEEVGFGEVDEALGVATADATGLAGEAKAVHRRQDSEGSVLCGIGRAVYARLEGR